MSYAAALAKAIYSNTLSGASAGPTAWLTTAAPFNGTSTSVDSGITLATAGASFAVSVWAKVASGENSALIDNTLIGTAGEGMVLIWGHSSSAYRGVGYTRASGGTYPTPTGGPASPSANTWNHYGLVYASGVLTTYLNGSSVGSLSNAIAYQLTDPILFGVKGSPAAYLTGDMSQALILNGGTASDIAQLFAGPEPTYTSGAITLNADLTYSDTLVWESYSNGSVTETTTLEHYIASQWETDPDSFTVPVDGRDYRVRISASNTGGNDPDEDQVSNTITYTAPTTANHRITLPLTQQLTATL